MSSSKKNWTKTGLATLKDESARTVGGEVITVKDDDLQQFNNMQWGDGSTKDVTAVWDENFLDFSKWLRKDYHSRYTRQDFRDIQFRACLDLIFALTALLATYCYLRMNYWSHFYVWGLPFFVLALWTIQKEEVVHMRSHWPTKMTGSDLFDKGIDYTMMVLTGASKETFRRRHVAAHYSDIGNLSRIFSDVWIPFVQLPAIYYFRPMLLAKVIMDHNYIRDQKLDRKQLIIEAIGLYCYIAVAWAEVLFDSYFIVLFHLAPLLIFHGAQILAATLAHGGIDKRNSFNSNGLFDPWRAQGLFRVTLVMVDWLSNGGARNHGIHHGYSQAPLELINRDFRRINEYATTHYQDVRLNEVLAMRVHENMYSRLPPPHIGNYLIQILVVALVAFSSVLTVCGLPIVPVQFEPWLVDYRISTHFPNSQRCANLLGLHRALRVRERARSVMNPNAYLQYVYGNLPYFEQVCAASPPPFGIPDLDDKVAPDQVLQACKLGKYYDQAFGKAE